MQFHAQAETKALTYYDVSATVTPDPDEDEIEEVAQAVNAAAEANLTEDGADGTFKATLDSGKVVEISFEVTERGEDDGGDFEVTTEWRDSASMDDDDESPLNMVEH